VVSDRQRLLGQLLDQEDRLSAVAEIGNVPE
jgi:hypothetical protein